MGHVKTRLVAGLGVAAATSLHQAFVYDMTEALSTLDADLFIATDDGNAWSELGIPVVLQRGKDLGERIRQAAWDALAAGRAACAIVGSDAPTLPARHVSALLASRSDVAIGPAEDGGFYAIACRRTDAAMFDGVRWSTGATLQETQAALARVGLSHALGSMWFDVDTPEDLNRLTRGDLPRHTRRWTEVNLASG